MSCAQSVVLSESECVCEKPVGQRPLSSDGQSGPRMCEIPPWASAAETLCRLPQPKLGFFLISVNVMPPEMISNWAVRLEPE